MIRNDKEADKSGTKVEDSLEPGTCIGTSRPAQGVLDPIDSSPRSSSNTESGLRQGPIPRSANEPARQAWPKGESNAFDNERMSNLASKRQPPRPSQPGSSPTKSTPRSRDPVNTKPSPQTSASEVEDEGKNTSSRVSIRKNRQEGINPTNRKRKLPPSENCHRGTTSRGKGSKSTDVPSRPLSAYNIFFSDQRAQIMAEREANNGKVMTSPESGTEEDGSMNETETMQKKAPSPFFERLAKRVGRRWRRLPEDERAKYSALAKKDKQRYRDDLEALHQKKMTETMERVVAEQGQNFSHSSLTDTTAGNSPCIGRTTTVPMTGGSGSGFPASQLDESWLASAIMTQSLLCHPDIASSVKRGSSRGYDLHRQNVLSNAASFQQPNSMQGNLDHMTMQTLLATYQPPAIVEANQQLPWNPFLRPEEMMLSETLNERRGRDVRMAELESCSSPSGQHLPSVLAANHQIPWIDRRRLLEAISSQSRSGISDQLNAPVHTNTALGAILDDAAGVPCLESQAFPSNQQSDESRVTRHCNTQPQSIDSFGSDDQKVQFIPAFPSTTCSTFKRSYEEQNTKLSETESNRSVGEESNSSRLLAFLSSAAAREKKNVTVLDKNKVELAETAKTNQEAQMTLMNLAVQEFQNQQQLYRHLGHSSSITEGPPISESCYSTKSKSVKRRHSVVIHRHNVHQQQEQQTAANIIRRDGQESRGETTKQERLFLRGALAQQIDLSSVPNSTSDPALDHEENLRILQQLERIRQQYCEQTQNASQNESKK